MVFGRNRRRSKERVKQTNIAVKLFPYILNLDSGEPYFSSKATVQQGCQCFALKIHWNCKESYIFDRFLSSLPPHPCHDTNR